MPAGAVSTKSGLYITAVNFKYRDFRYVIPFIVLFGIFGSSVVFSGAELTRQLHLPRILYPLDPAIG